MSLQSKESVIGIVGAGTMGAGIAQVAAMAGHEVRLFDSGSGVLVAARNRLLAVLNRLAEKGKISDAEAKAVFGRMYFLENTGGLKGSDLVIEAVVEDLRIKSQVFAQLEEICGAEMILATNTSSLSVTSIAGACKHPERVLGVHFFNPAPLMKLVEVVPALQTAKEKADLVVKRISQWDKTVVIAGDLPGFIVNRIARPYYSEALRIYAERILHGIPDGEPGFALIDAAMTEAGFRMGPFTLMDFIGNDVNYAVTRSVWEACFFEPRYTPDALQRRLVEAGWLGKKSGRGYFRYDGATVAAPDLPGSSELKAMISGRILTMLLHEAADAVLHGVASAEDIDLAMRAGVNYPIDLLREIDRRGAAVVVADMDRLFDAYRDSRYRCTVLLRKYAQEGRGFYAD